MFLKIINLMGQRFGKLIVIEKAEDYISPKGKHESKWFCKCDCGNVKAVRQSDLRSGRTKSCGHCKSYSKEQNIEKIPYNRFKDITGQTFGRLTALYRIGKNKQNSAIWHCKCQCGKEIDVSLPVLQSRKSLSCGCLKKEKLIGRNTKHGLTNTRIYREWKAIKERCYRPTHEYYDYYGGKGIRVCEDWKNNFNNFYDWAINNGYQDDLTIDRKDNSEDYCPENCHWVTFKEQANNRTNNIVVNYNGTWLSINEVASILGKSYGYIYQHYRNLGLVKYKKDIKED